MTFKGAPVVVLLLLVMLAAVRAGVRRARAGVRAHGQPHLPRLESQDAGRMVPRLPAQTRRRQQPHSLRGRGRPLLIPPSGPLLTLLWAPLDPPLGPS
eukprot:1195766-Prorocentrum_minimum.AAC.9